MTSSYGNQGDKVLASFADQAADVAGRVGDVVDADDKGKQPAVLNPEASEFQFHPPVQPGYGFGELPDGGDISDPYKAPLLDELIAKLVDPPRQSYDRHHQQKGRIHIKLTWVMKTVGEPHFINHPYMHRNVLRSDSKLRTHGIQFGLPLAYYNWLCGSSTQRELWMDDSEFGRVPATHRMKFYEPKPWYRG